MKFGAWIEATVDINRPTEFTNDDVDQYSDVINLGEDYEKIVVHLGEAISIGTIQPYVQRTAESDEVPIIKHKLDADATGSFAHADTAATTIRSIDFVIGGYQYLRIRLTGDQSADRTVWVRGVN